MRVAAIIEQGSSPEPGFEPADGVVECPIAPGSNPENWVHYEDTAASLREALIPLASGARPSARPLDKPSHPALVRLKQISGQLRASTSDGNILDLVLGFASEIFPRVVMFVLREGSLDAATQRGLDRAGGPSEERLLAISFPRGEEPEAFRGVLESRNALVSTLAGVGDERLALLLGNSPTRQAYIAPIESGGGVSALLYADNQPTADSIPDTTALEIVLDQAGLALDRGLLRRALAEAGDLRCA
jgi:hypothetical protein